MQNTDGKLTNRKAGWGVSLRRATRDVLDVAYIPPIYNYIANIETHAVENVLKLAAKYGGRKLVP